MTIDLTQFFRAIETANRLMRNAFHPPAINVQHERRTRRILD